MDPGDYGNVYMINEEYFELKNIVYQSSVRIGMVVKAKFSGIIRIFGHGYYGMYGFEPLVTRISSYDNFNRILSITSGTEYTIICCLSDTNTSGAATMFGTLE